MLKILKRIDDIFSNKYLAIVIFSVFLGISGLYFFNKQLLEGWFLLNIFTKYILAIITLYLSFKAIRFVGVSIKDKKSKNIFYSLISLLMMHYFSASDIVKAIEGIVKNKEALPDHMILFLFTSSKEYISCVLLTSNFIELPIFLFATFLNFYYTFTKENIDIELSKEKKVKFYSRGEKRFIKFALIISLLWTAFYIIMLDMYYAKIPGFFSQAVIASMIIILKLLYTYKPSLFLVEAINKYKHTDDLSSSTQDEILKSMDYNNKSIILRCFNKLEQLRAGKEVLNFMTYIIAFKATVIYILVNCIYFARLKNYSIHNNILKKIFFYIRKHPKIFVFGTIALIEFKEIYKIISNAYNLLFTLFCIILYVAYKFDARNKKSNTIQSSSNWFTIVLTVEVSTIFLGLYFLLWKKKI